MADEKNPYQDSDKKTYGVGPGDVKGNTAGNVNHVAKIDDFGRVFDRGEKIFDPTENPDEYLIPDGFDKEDPDSKKNYREGNGDEDFKLGGVEENTAKARSKR